MQAPTGVRQNRSTRALNRTLEFRSRVMLRAADFKPDPEVPLFIFVEASDLSENRFALFGPMR